MLSMRHSSNGCLLTRCPFICRHWTGISIRQKCWTINGFPLARMIGRTHGKTVAMLRWLAGTGFAVQTCVAKSEIGKILYTFWSLQLAGIFPLCSPLFAWTQFFYIHLFLFFPWCKSVCRYTSWFVRLAHEWCTKATTICYWKWNTNGVKWFHPASARTFSFHAATSKKTRKMHHLSNGRWGMLWCATTCTTLLELWLRCCKWNSLISSM